MNLNQMFTEQKIFFNQDITIPINFRLINLNKLKKSLIENEQNIYKALNKDLGKSNEDSFVYEYYHCLKEINFFIRNLSRLSRPKKIRTSIINFKSRGYIYKKPYGVCLIIGCWNYPLFLSLIPLIGAIASGNTCILKLHPLCENTNKIIKDILSNIFEPCYVTAIDGDEKVLDDLLTFNFDYIFATGSPSFGKYIYQKASNNLIPITLELGGKNSCIVHNDADIRISCRRIANGKFVNSGQTCLSPDVIYVHEDIKEAFTEQFISTINDMYSSDPISFKHYSRIINEKNYNRLIGIINENKNRLVFGGIFDDSKLKISPTILDEGELIDQEIFGPIIQIKSYKIIDDIIYYLKSSSPSLAFYLFSNNRSIINKCLDIPFGGGCINDTLVHISEIKLPFGGFKTSGIGNYRGKFSFDTFTHDRSVLFKSTKFDIKLRYPNNKNYYLDKLKSLLK